ncbi:MAG: hypothetical protein M1820_005551 [Bogoriella megaspora]|nr:MAG: hypothetical protein M1820_005551 [Bogoriella megaspora]
MSCITNYFLPYDEGQISTYVFTEGPTEGRDDQSKVPKEKIKSCQLLGCDPYLPNIRAVEKMILEIRTRLERFRPIFQEYKDSLLALDYDILWHPDNTKVWKLENSNYWAMDYNLEMIEDACEKIEGFYEACLPHVMPGFGLLHYIPNAQAGIYDPNMKKAQPPFRCFPGRCFNKAVSFINKCKDHVYWLGVNVPQLEELQKERSDKKKAYDSSTVLAVTGPGHRVGLRVGGLVQQEDLIMQEWARMESSGAYQYPDNYVVYDPTEDSSEVAQAPSEPASEPSEEEQSPNKFLSAAPEETKDLLSDMSDWIAENDEMAGARPRLVATTPPPPSTPTNANDQRPDSRRLSAGAPMFTPQQAEHPRRPSPTTLDALLGALRIEDERSEELPYSNDEVDISPQNVGDTDDKTPQTLRALVTRSEPVYDGTPAHYVERGYNLNRGPFVNKGRNPPFLHLREIDPSTPYSYPPLENHRASAARTTTPP